MAKAGQIDRRNYHWLLGVIYVMILFGLVMILSASSVRAFAATGDSYHYVKRQLIAILLGSILILLFSQIRVRALSKIATASIFVAIAMLAAVLIPGIGKVAGGSSRWIPVGFFNLQPSEFTKIAVALYTADFLARRKNKPISLNDLIYPYGILMIIIVFLVMEQPDLGTTLSICLLAFIMLFLGGLNLKYVAAIAAAGLAGGAYFIFSSEGGYRLERFKAFLDPSSDPLGSGWHIKQSLIALGSGGLFGAGLSLGRQKFFYLPAPHTDFIFAVIGEELGLLGTIFTVSLFVIFTYYGIKISLRCKDYFGRLLGIGLTVMIAIQALVNMGAVTGVLPVTGIPMPFISYGGSSLLVNMAAVGILFSIALNNIREDLLVGRRRNLRLVVGNRSSNRLSNRSTSRSSKSRSASGSRSRLDLTTKTSKTRRAKSNAGGNKRRRNSRSRISRSSSRQGTPKGKKRS